MNQSRGIKRMAMTFLTEVLRGQSTQLLVYQRQELGRDNRGISLAKLRQDVRRISPRLWIHGVFLLPKPLTSPTESGCHAPCYSDQDSILCRASVNGRVHRCGGQGLPSNRKRIRSSHESGASESNHGTPPRSTSAMYTCEEQRYGRKETREADGRPPGRHPGELLSGRNHEVGIHDYVRKRGLRSPPSGTRPPTGIPTGP